MRLRPALTRLLVVLLLLQWGTAFGHCLRLAAPAEGFAVEICTPEGLHRVVLPSEPGDAQHDHHAVGGICPACLGPAGLALTPPPVVAVAPVILAQSADPQPPPPAPLPAPGPSPSCRPRAPPTS
ncbi:DUF2946 family protein [Falsiroseomonas oryzae]|uniref:DUF2946 family protein n=1 Tax=Falsiroseomonas oryzae TaxID=2766473 RepID=UPI0022EA36FD|nr:DUF2946 family protein [Roseomonas sp. MO-31]